MSPARLARLDPHGAAGLAGALAGSRQKRISAMIRVWNEAEFLTAAVRSIAPFVDEVVLIDNASTDATPELMQELARELPIVRTFTYPHRLARAGGEHRQAVARGDRSSAALLSSYYNWSLAQCRCPFVLKWDADMIAGPDLGPAWQRWRSGTYLSMWFKGINAHPDRTHVLAARSDDPAIVGGPLGGDPPPAWMLDMSEATGELRLFPRFGARFDDDLWWWCENLRSPFRFGFGPPTGRLARRLKLAVQEPLYLHLKFCKHQWQQSLSDDFAAALQANLARGERLPVAWERVLAEHGLAGAAEAERR